MLEGFFVSDLPTGGFTERGCSGVFLRMEGVEEWDG